MSLERRSVCRMGSDPPSLSDQDTNGLLTSRLQDMESLGIFGDKNEDERLGILKKVNEIEDDEDHV